MGKIPSLGLLAALGSLFRNSAEQLDSKEYFDRDDVSGFLLDYGKNSSVVDAAMELLLEFESRIQWHLETMTWKQYRGVFFDLADACDAREQWVVEFLGGGS